MENMKMSEVFPMAFRVEHNKSFEVQDASWYSYGEWHRSIAEQDSAIEHAVLNHDRLVEENAELKDKTLKLTTALYQLRDYLSDIEYNLDQADGRFALKDEIGLIDEALTIDREE